MKRVILYALTASVILLVITTPVGIWAQSTPEATLSPAVSTPTFEIIPTQGISNSSNSMMDKPLCAPRIYLIKPADCLLMGPAKALTDLAQKGLTLPLKPLPAVKPDPSLAQIDKKYAKLNLPYGDKATFYPNPESAVAGVNALRELPPGQNQYISYKSQAIMNGNPYVMVETNEWIRASPTNYSFFQGLQFVRQPTNDFGWIVEDTNPRISTSYLAKALPIKLTGEMVVQVYDQVEAEKTTWYMVGLGQWVDQRYIRVVDIHSPKPEGVDNDRWIEVDLNQQVLTVHEGGKILFATLLASGAEPYFTRPGLFKITEKKEYETMTGAFETGKVDYYLFENVPFTMYYDQKRALHGAFWRAWFGYPQSHGCVNLSIGDAHWLFNWANEGDWVYVWDPSGKTPTDPAFYGDRGAF